MSKSLALALCAVASLVACADEHPAQRKDEPHFTLGGGTSDPTVGDDIAPASGSDVSSVVDAGTSSGAGDDAPQAYDAGALPMDDGEVPQLKDAGPCPNLGECAEQAQPLDQTVQTPSGPLHLSWAFVGYWDGFTSGLELSLLGETADGPQLITVTSFSQVQEALPPGRYSTKADLELTSVDMRSCGGSASLRDVQLTVERDDAPHGLGRDAKVDFRGHLTVLDPGWSADIPFQLEKSCFKWVDL